MDNKKLKETVVGLILSLIILGLWNNFNDVQAMKVREPYTAKDVQDLKEVVKKLTDAVVDLRLAVTALSKTER